MRDFIKEARFDLYLEGKKLRYREEEEKGNEDTNGSALFRSSDSCSEVGTQEEAAHAT